MLTESFIAATDTVKPPAAHLSSNLKDVGIFLHEFQPRLIFRQGYKKSSIAQNCLAISSTHIFAAQTGKATVNVYNRIKHNQEATVPFPEKVSSIAFAHEAAILVIGTQDGKLILWEVATGRVSTSSASHIEAVISLTITSDGSHILSASSDCVHVWSLRELVVIAASSTTSANTVQHNIPLASFTQHRSAITAVAASHSTELRTSFAVSASEDKTCYIWNIENQEILRTILLTDIPRCIVLDPADRAVYVGTTDGGVQQIDLLLQQAQINGSILNTGSRIASTALQLKPTDCFVTAQSSDIGATDCICMSYDGARILTGHHSGKILQWDVAKHRQAGEVIALSGQPVSAIMMLRPDGLRNHAERYRVQAIVKPNLEMSSLGDGKIPREYTLHAQVLHEPPSQRAHIDAMTSSGFSRNLLDAAVQSLITQKVSLTNNHSSTGELSGKELYTAEALQQELAAAKEQLAHQAELEQERFQRYMNRRGRRDDIDMQKRQAFFSASSSGQNGDAAMESFSNSVQHIDAESEDELLHTSTEGQANGTSTAVHR